MNFLSAENISKSYGDKLLFEGLSFGINQGERIALIGINGSGKSSLLKIIAGDELPDSGNIALRKGIKIGFLGQNPVLNESESVFENVFTGNHPLMSQVREYELLSQITPLSPTQSARLQGLVEEMTMSHAWEYESRIREIISRMGIGTYIQQPVGLLSGGQKKRVAMARVLMEEPDLLILDEPTNHLDLETVEWLEVMVLDRFPTLLLVTHDRYFLDNVCNMMVELDKGEVFKYKGNYAYFLEKKEAREEVRNAEIDKAQNLMKRELEWIRRQPKARGTKAKYRVDAFGAIKQKAQRQKTDSSLELQMKTTRLGGKVINLKNIAKRYDEMVLVREFSHSFQKGERVGIIGKNGVGKTTFLQILTGALPPDKGDWDIGETTVIGYYRQDDSSLPENKRVLEVVKDMAEVIELANGDKITCSQFLQMFLFPPYMHHAFVSTLSGGEKRRLQLLCVLIKNPNFLILDEPTNDLDIGTLNVLEEFLENYAGTLVLVSHDRYFMDKIIDHLFVFEGEGEIRDFPGNYTDYREWLKEEQEMKRAEVKKQVLEVAPEPPAKMEAKRKRSFKQQKHYEHLETEIASLEQEKKELTALLNSGETDYSQLLAATTRLKSVEDLLDEKSLEWLELSEWEAFG